MKPKTSSLTALAMTVILSGTPAETWADHGRDFLLAQTARLGPAGHVFAIARVDYSRHDGEKTIGFEPLLSWTARDWLSLEINADLEKTAHEGLVHEATVPGLRLRLLGQDHWQLGIAARYVIPASGHDEEAVKLAALVSYEAGGWLFALNAHHHATDESSDWRYVGGIKGELRHHLSLGLEITGDLDRSANEIVAGLFYEINHGFQVNTGVGMMLEEDEPSLKTALIWRFP